MLPHKASHARPRLGLMWIITHVFTLKMQNHMHMSDHSYVKINVLQYIRIDHRIKSIKYTQFSLW